MPRLSYDVLLRIQEFLLELYGCSDFSRLGRLIPERMARLIPCDRASFNDLNTDPRSRAIIPTPIPTWWPRFGAVYQRHMMDHPLWRHRPIQAVQLSQLGRQTGWPQSALYNEYFVPLGIRHQLSTAVLRRKPRMVGIAFNRARTDFSPAEVKTLELVSPHLRQALENALTLAAFRQSEVLVDEAHEPSITRTAVLAVDPESAKVRSLSTQAGELLRRAFAVDASGGRLAPPLHHWLKASLRRNDVDTVGAPIRPLLSPHVSGQLLVRIVSVGPSEVVLMLKDTSPRRVIAPTLPRAPVLTQRETEVLHWIREGKRNSEIATILGISPRTVGKHIEHVMAKLGAETRTAAARLVAEQHHPRVEGPQ